MKILGWTFFVSLIGYCCFQMPLNAEEKAATPEEPNIVIIHVDDLGWRDLGCMKSPVYETPNIDRLAKSGMLFTSAYAAAAICTPARASMLTGSQPTRHGIYTVNKNRGKKEQWKVLPEKNRAYLEKDYPTIGHLLTEAEIPNGAIGKWHVFPKLPSHGFKEGELGGYLGLPINYFAPFKLGYLPKDVPDGTYLPKLIREAGVRFIERNKEKRFFLYYSTYLPHDEIRNKESEPEGEGTFRLAAPKDLVEKYRDKIAALKKEGRDLEGHENPTYAAMIQETDQSVGAIVDAVEKLGLVKQTLVLFISDNGGLVKYTAQSPLRGEKASLYEGGIRVPMIASMPGKIRSGVISDEPVSGIDFFPTICALLNLKPQSPGKVDGDDLSKVLFENKTLGERNLFWTFPNYIKVGEADKSPRSVMRRGDWKIHHLYEDNQYELYHLKEDLGEAKNLAVLMPNELARMKRELKKCYFRFGAESLLRENPDFKKEVFEELRAQEKRREPVSVSTSDFYKSIGLSQ